MVKMLCKMCCMPTLISQTEVEGSPQPYLLCIQDGPGMLSSPLCPMGCLLLLQFNKNDRSEWQRMNISCGIWLGFFQKFEFVRSWCPYPIALQFPVCHWSPCPWLGLVLVCLSLYDSPVLLSFCVMCIFIKICLLYISSNNSFPNMTAVEPKSLFPLIGTQIWSFAICCVWTNFISCLSYCSINYSCRFLYLTRQ